MNCQVKCRQKCQLLGSLEQKIIEVLWNAKNPLKPAEVLIKIEGEYSYTTIMTVLKRMSLKGILKRELNGKVYFYSPLKIKETFVADCLNDLFARPFDCYGQAVVDSFYSSAKKANIKTSLAS